MKLHRLALLAGAALLALAAARAALGPAVPAVAVRRGDIVQSVVASGRVRPHARVRVGAEVAGTVLAVNVREGARVAAGDLLVQLDEAIVRAEAEQARASLAQVGEVASPSTRAGLAQAEATLVKAEADRERARRLRAEGVLSEEQDQQAEAVLATARARRADAAVQASGSGRAGTAERLARASLSAAEARLARTRLRAPAPGVVLTRSVEPGDAVQPGKVLLELAIDGPTELVMEPDERNLPLLREGQPALASADAFPDRRFPARVSAILPGVDAQRGTLEVRLAVPEPPDYLRPDLTVSVDVEVARRNGTLLLSTEAVREPLSARPWALAVRSGRARRQELRLGARGEREVEVLEGLAEGDLVLSGPATAGARVRPRVP
jgi:HlyD family secretion protein